MCPAQVTLFEEPVSHKHISNRKKKKQQKQAIPNRYEAYMEFTPFFYF